jgi:hypothetical protein
VLDPAPSTAWQRLREPGLPDVERDRRAILAMAGPYRVSFDFLEVVRFDPLLKPDAPYQSWGTEYVYVSEDRPDFIALQHILVMRVQTDAGKVSEPVIVRHWRQEWRYQPETLLTYEGANTWVRRSLSPEQRRGRLGAGASFRSMDSPRYAAAGRWEHGDSFSTWLSDETWRPLPRREFSVRKDYQVLVGANRHTITPNGWGTGGEQPEGCAGRRRAGRARPCRTWRASTGSRATSTSRTTISAPGERYFALTEPFWAEVRAAWREIERRDGRFTLRAPVDQGQLFMPFFDYADKLSEGGAFDRSSARAFVEKTLRDTYLAGPIRTAVAR